MSYYYLQTSNDHLAHHGILGMRWGIRRYQPYPKGHRGGREVGEAARKPSKVKAAGEKIKSVVKSSDFKANATVAVTTATLATAAAIGSVFLGSSSAARALSLSAGITAANLIRSRDTLKSAFEESARRKQRKLTPEESEAEEKELLEWAAMEEAEALKRNGYESIENALGPVMASPLKFAR